MSKQYPGGLITKTAPVPSGSFENSTAPGIWTLEQQAYWQKLGQWPIPGNTQVFIEDVFSTWLYTGNGTTQTITNNINLSGNGGMVWTKSRSNGTYEHELFDTVRGAAKRIRSNSTDAQQTVNSLTAFGSSGYDISTDSGSVLGTNGSGATYVSWTFREQPKFFDIVTYTGNGANRSISHNLGSAPGCIFIKCTSTAENWLVYHRSYGATGGAYLNTTDQFANDSTYFNDTSPTSTNFTLSTAGQVNTNGATYVAYLFAHDAGGFGLTGTDNVISCGSFTTDGSGNASVTLGYEPQFVMWKKSSASGAWNMQDVMRGMPVTGDGKFLEANAPDAEYGASQPIRPNATGFYGALTSNASSTYIYIAIRRGPMRTPTVGTSVFTPVARTGNGTSTALTSPNIITDMAWIKSRAGYDNPIDATRLIGLNRFLFQNSDNAEISEALTTVTAFDSMLGYTVGTGSRVNGSGSTYINWAFKRAPSFFDVVCYTGNGSAGTTRTHNLGVVPEFMIVKRRNAADNWAVYHSALTASNVVQLNTTSAASAYSGYWNNTAPTASVFTTGAVSDVNGSASTYVAHLFATCAGVSKVGSYTGTGTLTTINCGFTGGARWVMIKRTDSTGPWYIWDTARGMAAGTDPSLMINDSEIEVNANSVYTIATGFQLLASPSVDVNTSSGTYIFLAIA